jgi:hypothetical protein
VKWLGYGLDGRGSGVRFPAGARYFSLLSNVPKDSGSHSVSYLMGTGGFSPGLKRQEREADHSPLPSAVVKNGGAVLQLLHTSSLFGP